MSGERLRFYLTGMARADHMQPYPTPWPARIMPPRGWWKRLRWTIAEMRRKWRLGMYSREARRYRAKRLASLERLREMSRRDQRMLWLDINEAT